MSELEIASVIGSILDSCDSADRVDAKTFFRAVVSKMITAGWKVSSEVPVPYRGDGKRGRVDIVINEPFHAALELDNWTPREKSITKLRHFHCPRFIGLRNTPNVLIVV